MDPSLSGNTEVRMRLTARRRKVCIWGTTEARLVQSRAKSVMAATGMAERSKLSQRGGAPGAKAFDVT